MALSKLEFDNLLSVIPRLSPEQTRVMRQQLEDYWREQFSEAVDSIRSRVSSDISEDEIEADIKEAIREVRAQKS